MRRLLLLVVVLIAHGTLYPWKFHSPTLASSAVVSLLHSWAIPSWSRYVLRDIAVNLVLYVPFGIFGYLALRNHARRSVAMTGTLLLAALLSASLEIAQAFVPPRNSTLFDVFLNVVGTALGGALALRFEDRLVEVAAPGIQVAARAASGPIVLLCCWVGYQLFPFFPDLSRTHVAEKLQLLASADSWSAQRTLVSVAEWLAVGTLLETFGPGKSLAYLALLLLLPLKLVCAGRTMTGAEVVGAAVASLVSSRLRPGGRTAARSVAWLLLVALILDGLAPFRFQDVAGTFRWLPFVGLFEADWQSAFAVLLRKSFAYGSVVWLLRRSGWGFASAAALTSLCLAVVEAAQVYLPGRTAELADPLLVVLMAVVLSLVEGRETTGPVASNVRVDHRR